MKLSNVVALKSFEREISNVLDQSSKKTNSIFGQSGLKNVLANL